MNKNPLVSIIIRTKNEKKMVKSVFRKVSSQSYKNFEIIIVDNQSKDKTLKIAKKYNVKILKIRNFSR